MGYYTWFEGCFEITPALSEEHKQTLEDFFNGEYNEDEYPSYSCDFGLDKRGRYLYPKFGRTREYDEWLKYLKKHYFDKWGYTLSGTVLWRGENTGDAGDITIRDGNIIVTYLWYDMDEIISRLPHVDVPSPITPLNWIEDLEYREFDVKVTFNKKITKEHAKWINDFASTIHYARKNVDESVYGKDGELFIDPVELDRSTYDGGSKYEFMALSLDELLFETDFVEPLKRIRKVNREAELQRMRTTPAGECPDLFCQWKIENGKLVHDGETNFSRPVEWLQFLIRKFFEPNGYVLNGKIRWNGYGEFYDRGTIFIKENKVAAYLVPYLKPLNKRFKKQWGWL